ncbi:MAG: GGDEF domain-containing protein [Myxococcaceae bacterium]
MSSTDVVLGAEVSSQWERHQLALHGLKVTAVAGVLASAAMLAADLWLGVRGRDELATLLSRSALTVAGLGSFGVALGAFFGGQRITRPTGIATALLLLLVVAGAVGATAAGGLNGLYPLGLVPLFLVGAAVIPGGARVSALAGFGAVALHVFVLRMGISTGQFWPQAAPTLLLLVVVAVAGLAYSEFLERARWQLSRKSRHDPLTGALTRAATFEELALLVSRRARRGVPLALVLFDVDRFKLLNDTHGRNVGDEVLEVLAAAVRVAVRTHDFVGRYGYDEFILLLDECDGTQALAVVERIREALTKTPVAVRNEQLFVTFAAGIISVRANDQLTEEALLRAVEKALLDSKETQRSRTVLVAAAPPAQPAEIWTFPQPPPTAAEHVSGLSPALAEPQTPVMLTLPQPTPTPLAAIDSESESQSSDETAKS